MNVENTELLPIYYVYVWFDAGEPIYIGKGKGDRDVGSKNVQFERDRVAFGSNWSVKRVIVGLTSRQAETEEAQLIRVYRPYYNRNNGLSAPKWVDPTDKNRDDLLEVAMMVAYGEQSPTPRFVAVDLIAAIGPVFTGNVLFAEDRFGVLTCEFMKQNPTFSGTIAVCEDEEHQAVAVWSLTKEQRQMVTIRPANFLDIDFGDERFDVVIMNPPFSNKNKKGIYKIMYAKVFTLLKTSGVAGLIGPAGAGRSFYAKNRRHVRQFKYYTKNDLKIGETSCSFVWSKQESDDCVFSDWGMIDTRQYPKRVPMVRNGCTKEEYDGVFDQVNGLPFFHYMRTSYSNEKREIYRGVHALVIGKLVGGKKDEVGYVDVYEKMTTKYVHSNGKERVRLLSAFGAIPMSKQAYDAVAYKANKLLAECKIHPRWDWGDGPMMHTWDDMRLYDD